MTDEEGVPEGTPPYATLHEVLNMQEQLQVDSYQPNRSPRDFSDDGKIEFIKTNVLALTDELHEVLGETNWKPWKRGNEINTELYKEEMVDAFHFFMNLMIVVDMSADELLEGYKRKNKINRQRQVDGY